MTWLNRTHFGDCRDTMRQMIAAGVRVEMVLTSPPYDDLRVYPKAPRFTWEVFTEVASLLADLLVDGGVLCWNVGDSVRDGGETLTSCKQKIYFVEQCGLRVHDTMIYEKTNPANPETVRYNQCFEYVFVLSKGAPRAFNPIKDKPNVSFGNPRFGAKAMRRADGSVDHLQPRKPAAEFGLRSNVWRGLTAGQETPCAGAKHPAPMPYWLAFDHIRSWSNPGDIVLDPFHGSGTTGRAAQEQGRNWIGCESNADYAPLQQERTRQMGMAL